MSPKEIFKSPWLGAACLVAAALSFTPYFSFGAAIFIVLLAVRYSLFKSEFLDSVATRITIVFLLFAAWLMVLAMYAWLASIVLPPFVYILSFVALFYPAANKFGAVSVRLSKTHSFKSSALSFLLAIAGVAIVAASFYFPKPQLASTIQIITNGYDNSAHLSLIRTTYNQGGYVYGDYDSIKDKISWRTLTAYPQGWHFVNSFFWKGSGLNPFASNNISTQLNFYIASMFFWYVIAAFLLAQIMFYAARRAGIAYLRVENVLTLSGFHLLLQLLVFWGSLAYGFVTFLCAISYILLVGIVALQLRDVNKNDTSQRAVLLVLGTLFVCAVAQGWLFATPIAMAMLFLAFLPTNIKKIKRPLSKHALALLAISVAIFLPVLVQIAINLKFSTQGTSQINDDGGIFGISSTLAFVAIFASLFIVYFSKTIDSVDRRYFSSIILPALGFTGLLLAYQLYTLGHPAYFFTKSLALTLCLVWIPLTLGAIMLINKIRTSLPALHIIGMLLVVFLLAPPLLGQDISSFKKLLQRNSNITTSTATALARSAQNGDIVHKKIFLLTQEKYDGDVVGSIFALTAAQTQNQCTGDALWVIITRRPETFPSYANLCSQKDPVKVITSENTDSAIIQKFDSRIEITSTKAR